MICREKKCRSQNRSGDRQNELFKLSPLGSEHVFIPASWDPIDEQGARVHDGSRGNMWAEDVSSDLKKKMQDGAHFYYSCAFSERRAPMPQCALGATVVKATGKRKNEKKGIGKGNGKGKGKGEEKFFLDDL